MRNYLSLGRVPYEESHAQVRHLKQAKKEGHAYINQLIRQFGEPPEGSHLTLRGFDHKFGTYYKVVVYYDTDYPENTKYAYQLAKDCPANWDQQAIKEIK